MSAPIQIKIFLGFLQDSELKMYLYQSKEWNRAKILIENSLVEARRDEKDYIGLWIDPPLTYVFIEKKEMEVKSLLQLYCPKYRLDTHVLRLFPQVFIT